MNKKRNINRDLYPSKWKEFCEKYGETEAVEHYYSFSRSFCLEKYILKFGEKEGKNKFEEKNKKINKSMSLENCIKRHGDIKGTKIYEKWKQSVAQSKSNFIKRYGEKAGKEKFKEFGQKAGQILQKFQKSMPRQVHLDYWIKKCNGDIKEAKKIFKKRQQTFNLDKFVKKYGKKEGLKKYQELNKIKAQTLDNFVRRYGDIKGPEAYYRYIENIKYAKTKEYYIEKYGEKKGLEKYRNIITKRTSHIYKNGCSIIALDFCEKLNKLICNNFKKIYYGENEYKFFIWENNVKIAIVDFYVKDINVVIEFYGDFWHRNPNKYQDDISEKIRKKDKNRIDSISKKFGSEVIIIWEEDYRSDKEKIIKKLAKGLIDKGKNYDS